MKQAGSVPLGLDTGIIKNISNGPELHYEPSIAISRKNTNVIVVAAGDEMRYAFGMPFFCSTDTGQTWQRGRIPFDDVFPPIGYPSIVCDNNGVFYYAFVATHIDEPFATARIFVSTSTNGLNWEHPREVDADWESYDLQPTLAVDRTPGRQKVYVLWNRWPLDGEFSPIAKLAYTDSRGHSWDILPSEIAYNASRLSIKFGPKSYLVVGTNGWGFYDPSDLTGADTIKISIDDGHSFVKLLSYGYNEYPYNNEGQYSLKGDYGFPAQPITSFDIDLKAGIIHLVSSAWNDAAQLFYRYSTDMGITWSKSQMVGIADSLSNNKLKDRFYPSVSVDQNTGDAYVLYYSSEHDPKNLLTKVMRQKLTPDMSEPQRTITEAAFDLRVLNRDPDTQIPYIGTHIGSDAVDGIYAACWIAKQEPQVDGEIFAFVTRVSPSDTLASVDPIVVHATRPIITSVNPNPSTGDRIALSYFSPGHATITAELFTVDGKQIATLYSGAADHGTSKLDLQPPDVPNGSYFLKITSPYGTAERQIVIAR